MEKSIWKLFLQTVKKYPKKIAIIYEQNTICYSELKNKSELLSYYLYKKGIRSNSLVGVYMDKSIDYVITVLSLLNIGSTIIPLSVYYNNDDIDSICCSCDIKTIVTDKCMLNKIKKSNSSLKCSVIEFPTIDYSMQIETVPRSVIGENAFLLLTSGSTSKPKATIVSQFAMVYRLEMEMNEFNLSEKDNVLISTPIYHSLGLRLLLTSICYGMTTTLLRSFVPNKWITAIYEQEISYTITIPSQIAQVIEYIKTTQIDAVEKLSSLRLILSTSSFLPNSTKTEFLKHLNCRFINFIASSETEFIAWADCKWEDPEGNLLGKPFENTELLLSMNDEIINERGTYGEILCKSKQLFSGYYNNDEATSAAFWNGYYKTGDLGYFDDIGLLHYYGRKKNIIICSGVNIIPKDIENKLQMIPGVRECVAFGIPHKTYGEIVGVLVAGDNLTEIDIKQFCINNLSQYQQPRKIFVVKEIPKNEMGKISIKKIKETYCK